MLLGSYEFLSSNPLWTGVFIGSSFIILGILLLLIRRARDKRFSAGGRSSSRYFSSVADLNDAIEFSGFAYDPEEDIFYSLMNPWQREYGYCRFYDESAAALSMIIDAEPIYFDYDGKHWLIEFWKGQYGMTTGGEVGIYNTDSDSGLIDWNGRHYQSANDHEMLHITTTVYKNGRPLINRQDVHWWLTGFVLGEFSQPDELTMIIRITFDNAQMRNAFIKGLQKAGYTPHEYRVKQLAVAIHFGEPHTPQAFTRTKITDNMTQDRNRQFCEMYQKITSPFTSMLDKINALHEENEELYNRAVHIGKQRELFQSLNKLKGQKEPSLVDSQQA
ncbi:MAG: DUF4474 domain-containing protein [Oscillospiraceae bacterium]|nr:DUF4474 domain-containing protein [Oscillospiraceae bacterium]MDD4414640.1 DUF4474 domain-containing protein [Oscillospiraceae bacterium]